MKKFVVDCKINICFEVKCSTEDDAYDKVNNMSVEEILKGVEKCLPLGLDIIDVEEEVE